VALIVAAGAVVAIAAAYGFGAFAGAWSQLRPGWIVLCMAAQVLAVPAYAFAYRALAHHEGGPGLRMPLVLRIVMAGFGPFTPRGGFALDKRALHAIEGNEEVAVTRVLGLGAMEWTVLAPAACLAAIALLAVGDPRPMPSVLWPWAVAVPVGFSLGFWLAAPTRRKRICTGSGRARRGLAHLLRGVDMVRSLACDVSSCWPAWLATAGYWAFDIASFYGAVRFFGLGLGVGEAIIAYATGYALTRRSTPLGGAGVTEVLMTFALHWMGVSVAAALASVVVYRVFNFALPALLALFVQPRVDPLLNAADDGRTPAGWERRVAAAPFGSRLPGWPSAGAGRHGRTT
jgi:uncharacterized membrane protein YbhN (UPF0104 family)